MKKSKKSVQTQTTKQSTQVATQVATTSPPTTSTPSFYEQYIQVQRSDLALTIFRIFFFGLLFYDLWFISLVHAPRYGVADFNVAHLPILEWFFVPNVSIQGAFYLIGGLLSLWMIFAWANQLAYFALALIYNIAYFDSQADSYQHHYLLSLVLIFIAFVPWNQHQTQSQNQEAKPASYRSHWALDAIAFELALVYLWTAFTKSESIWLSGQPLRAMVASSSALDHIQSVSNWLHISTDQLFQIGAWSVMIGEFMAPILLIVTPLRKIGFFIIPWFHIMVEWIGFDIELFSYYMLLFNFFYLSPDWIWRSFDRIADFVKSRLSTIIHIFSHLQKRLNHRKSTQQFFLFRIITTLVVYLLISQIQIEGKQIIALIAGACAFLFLDWRRFNMLYVLVVTFSLICAVMWLQNTETLYDYYRMWGGDLQRRNELEKSVEIYQIANQLKKSGNARHFALGQILVDLKRFDEATLVYLDGIDRHLREKERLKAYLFEHVNHRQSLEDQFQNEVQLADRLLSFQSHIKIYPIDSAKLKSNEQQIISQTQQIYAKAYQASQEQFNQLKQLSISPKREIFQVFQRLQAP